MLKQTITYTDLGGRIRTEDFYFHMDLLEIIEMEISVEGGITNHIDKLIKTENGPKAYLIFKDLILNAYGEKSDDDRRFIKVTDEGVVLRRHFEQCPACSDMIVGFIQDSDAGAAFVNALLPKDQIEKAEVEAAKRQAAADENKPPEEKPLEYPALSPVPETPPAPTNDKTKFEDFTKKELLEMPTSQWTELFGNDPKDWTKDQLLISYQRKSSE